ncbi:MAG: hypothetical protein IPJ56_21870 [Gemmatimonadetes bacterium]|nr:hypothetical protein [Gemmatimonadota bacterium]
MPDREHDAVLVKHVVLHVGAPVQEDLVVRREVGLSVVEGLPAQRQRPVDTISEAVRPHPVLHTLVLVLQRHAPEPPLLQAVTMIQRDASDRLVELQLLPHPVLGKAKRRGQLAERPRLGEGVAPVEADGGVGLVSNPHARQHLLHLVDRAAPAQADVVVGVPPAGQPDVATDMVNHALRFSRVMRACARAVAGAERRPPP